jgi:hypothetical protein
MAVLSAINRDGTSFAYGTRRRHSARSLLRIFFYEGVKIRVTCAFRELEL